MIVLLGLSALIMAFMGGVCLGAASVEDMNGEPALPEGWWVLPAGAMGGLLTAALIIWVG